MIMHAPSRSCCFLTVLDVATSHALPLYSPQDHVHPTVFALIPCIGMFSYGITPTLLPPTAQVPTSLVQLVHQSRAAVLVLKKETK